MKNNKYYKVSDGWFDYYVNSVTGEKKFDLCDNDVCIDRRVDDFCRESAAENQKRFL